MYHTIYKVTNQINGKFYIGAHKTKNLNDDYWGSGNHIRRAIKKYGIENFFKEILFVFETLEEMYAKEIELVTEELVKERNCYNLSIGGLGGRNYSEESKKKMSLAKTGVNNFLFGKKHSAETIKKMSAAKKGKKHSEESKKKMSEKHKGNQYSLGIRRSKETKKKMSEAIKGRRWIHNPKTKQTKMIPKNSIIQNGWVTGRGKLK